MTRKKIVITVGITLAFIGTYFAWDYYSHRLDWKVEKNSKSYKDGYKRVKDDLTKTGLEYKYPALADEYGAPTIELVLSKDYGYRHLNFPCVNQDWNYNEGLVDAYLDFVKAKYGDDFMEKAKLKSKKLEKEFNIVYYTNSLEKIANYQFRKQWTKDSVEIGKFNLAWAEKTPFILQFDTAYNKDWTDFQKLGDTIFFKAKSPYNDKKALDLPALAFFAYWKADSKFPYKDIPFSRIYLNSSKR